VKPGDTLSGISTKVYTTSRYWRRIQEANNIPDPTRLPRDMVLTIPPLTSEERLRLAGAASSSIPATAGGKRHTVVEGDTLSSISQEHYGTTRYYREIMTANGIDDERRLPVGKVLVIPDIEESVASRTSTTPTAGGELYVVQEDDTLSSIAADRYGTWRLYTLIMEANNIPHENALRVGQTLVIPPMPADAPARTPSAPSQLDTGERRYVVKEGDTLSEIAYDQMGSRNYYAAIQRRNNIADEHSIRPGQVLIIPSTSGVHVLSTRSEDR
jgi:nucleoid-associated protein YgaU